MALRDLPEGSTVHASLVEYDDEGAHPSYSIMEELRPKKKRMKEDFFDALFTHEDDDVRVPSLSIDRSAIRIHHIKKEPSLPLPMKSIQEHLKKQIGEDQKSPFD